MASFQWASRAAWVDELGVLTAEAARVIGFLLKPAAPLVDVTLLGSGSSYSFSNTGYLAVVGGTGLTVNITRAKITSLLGSTPGVYPVASGDLYAIVYATPPVLRFIPT